MPELPEVETTRRGIEPHIDQQRVADFVVRERRLRWPVPDEIPDNIVEKRVNSVERRGKYILIRFDAGDLMVHLGMSGSLRVLTAGTEPAKHDHVDLVMHNGLLVRLTDPRRFGSVLWQPKGDTHKLLAKLGPEPLSEAFNVDYLFKASRNRSLAIKQFIMTSEVVVGVGNIYANESLFKAGIDPRKPAGKVSKQRYERLVDEIKKVLEYAITRGGTTLRDFLSSDGKPGYFVQELSVYGRGGEACKSCGSTLKEIRQGQRATVFCPRCQR